MAIYHGERTIDGIVVLADGIPLDPAFALKRLSPLGFEWGYIGTAPDQLSLALLRHHLQDDTAALALYKPFTKMVVAKLGNEWQLTTDELEASILFLQMAKPADQQHA